MSGGPRRLVLFDVDGTLLDAGGAGRRAVFRALEAVFGTTGPRGGVSFAGRTDPQIARERLAAAGWSRDAVDARLDALWTVYLEELRRELAAAPPRVLPGVPALLERVGAAGGATVPGLLTGNVRDGARLKLEAAGIAWERFVVGAFGSDHAARPALPEVAVRRARERTGIEFAGAEVVVIGDTPLDVRCGDRLGTRTVAVATGGASAEALTAERPDHLFADLTDTEAVWRAIVGG